MPTFRYRALAPTGEVTNGTMEATTQAEVIARLQRQGSIPMHADLAAGGSWLAGLLHTDTASAGQSLRRQETGSIMRELATMLAAGQDLDRALRYVHETARVTRVRAVAQGLRDEVRDGRPFSVALARFPRAFSRLHVALVRAGEASGQLASTLEQLAELLERQQSLMATVTSALIYPSLLLLAAIGSVALLLTQVLPQFVPMFEQSGATLPPSTQMLIDAGNAMSSYWQYGLLGFILLLIGGRALWRRPGPRGFIDRLLLRLPVIGDLVREVLAARFTRVLGTLLVNGVSLIAALGVVRDAVGNSAAVAAIDHATTNARDGAGLSRFLADFHVFPPRTIHLLQLGEENAQLGPMALRAAAIHEERTRVTTQRLVALLVPAITIFMGLAVGGIVTSLMAAMLSLNDLAGG